MTANPNYEITELDSISAGGTTAEGRPFYLRMRAGTFDLWVGNVGFDVDDVTDIFENPSLYYQGNTEMADYFATDEEKAAILDRYLAIDNGRRYVGFDLNSDYLDLSLRTRFAQPSLGVEVAS